MQKQYETHKKRHFTMLENVQTPGSWSQSPEAEDGLIPEEDLW